MPRWLLTLAREYKATALTRAFLFGVVIFPALILAVITLIAGAGLLTSAKPPLEGKIAVRDTSEGARVLERMRARFEPDARAAEVERARRELRARVQAMAPSLDNELVEQSVDMALRQSGLLREAEVSLVAMPADADLAAYKQKLIGGELLAVIDGIGEALAPAGASYRVYHSRSLDASYLRRIRSAAEAAVVAERFEREGLDPLRISVLERAPEARTLTVTAAGEQATLAGMDLIVPGIFMLLLWVSVMTGGQYLLTSTVEEKSSRVMEVLLSAISPLQLLVGKILGQGLVGLTVLGVYLSVGLVGAAALGAVGGGQLGILAQVPLSKLPWLGLYFVMAYFFFAALMAAVGAAVTEIREAQSLMGPVMALIMVPIILWGFILQSPNSVFSQVVSFIPPVTPFVMILRVSQYGEPVALWQIVATTIVGFGGVVVAVLAAAKIFRVGVLMYGQPPGFLTLAKWLRHA